MPVQTLRHDGELLRTLGTAPRSISGRRFFVFGLTAALTLFAAYENAKVDPQNHIPFYAVGSVDWIIVHNTESKLSPEEKSTMIEEGMTYLDKAMALNPDYEDTLWYENLLLREKANLIDDKVKARICTPC